MLTMGFDCRWVHLIMQCISTVTYQVVLNEACKCEVMPQRGLRQGDPLSPYLFILAEEVLSRGLRKIFNDGLVKHFHLGRGTMLVSHLLFADDTLVFLRGNKNSLKNLLGFLKLYEGSFGQRISLPKSSMFCSKLISLEKCFIWVS